MIIYDYLVDFRTPDNSNKAEDEMTDMINQAVDCYLKTFSLKQTAEMMASNYNKVRKMLVSAGIYPTAKAREINNLHKQGCSETEIAKMLKMVPKKVNGFLPYTRLMYNLENPSPVALKERYKKARRVRKLKANDHSV